MILHINLRNLLSFGPGDPARGDCFRFEDGFPSAIASSLTVRSESILNSRCIWPIQITVEIAEPESKFIT